MEKRVDLFAVYYYYDAQAFRRLPFLQSTTISFL